MLLYNLKSKGNKVVNMENERALLKELSFNVNLVLDEKSLKKVKKFNQKLCEKIDSEIDFEEGCVPHITILIFKVKAEDAEKVCGIVWDFTSKINFENLKLKLKKIRVQNNYIMLDVENCGELIKISAALENLISPYIIRFSHWPIRKDNRPHITLGYCRDVENATKLFHGKRLSLVVKPIALRLSDKYVHGTVHGGFRIKLFKKK